MNRVVAVVAVVVACSADSTTEPATPIAASALTGQYRVSFAHQQTANPNRSCLEVEINFAASSWLPVNCPNADVTPDNTPAAVFIRSDTLFLHVVSLPGTRDIALRQFVGSPDRLTASWSGATCYPLGGVLAGTCLKELGTATLRRP